MRTLKFRVWSYEKGRFLLSYGNRGLQFYWGQGGAEDGTVVALDWFIQCEQVENPKRFKVTQWTGLKDINGREIYEDDVVRPTTAFRRGNFTWQNLIVQWDEKELCYMLGGSGHHFTANKKLEVVNSVI